jgi:hypothetical protein
MPTVNSTQFLTRRLAAAAIRDQGIPGTENTLSYLAHNGRGPTYSIINGRALYRMTDIEMWIRRQAAQGRVGDEAA